MLFQGVAWNKILPVDFRVIVKNPHVNTLQKPLVLSPLVEKYMMDTTIKMLETYTRYKKYNIKPWDVSGRLTEDDVNMLNIFEMIEKDAEKYKENKQNMKNAVNEIIDNRKRFGF